MADAAFRAAAARGAPCRSSVARKLQEQIGHGETKSWQQRGLYDVRLDQRDLVLQSEI